MDVPSASSATSREFIHTNIYWDLNTCPLPPCPDDWLATTRNVRAALKRALDFHLHIPMTGYCDTFTMSVSDHETLMTYMDAKYCIPALSVETKLVGDIMQWQRKTGKVSNLLIITGDPRVFSHFGELRNRKNNIFMAHPDGDLPDQVRSMVCYAWEFSRLCSGQPPYYECREMMQRPPLPKPWPMPRINIIYWDLNTCPLPRGRQEARVFVRNVHDAIALLVNYSGPIGIKAYGDFVNMPVADYRVHDNLMAFLVYMSDAGPLASHVIHDIRMRQPERAVIISANEHIPKDDTWRLEAPDVAITDATSIYHAIIRREVPNPELPIHPLEL